MLLREQKKTILSNILTRKRKFSKKKVSAVDIFGQRRLDPLLFSLLWPQVFHRVTFKYLELSQHEIFGSVLSQFRNLFLNVAFIQQYLF